MQNNGFFPRQTSGVSYYACAALEQMPGVRHGFSMRPGGVSSAPENTLNLGYTPWDAPANVQENRRRFLSALHLRPECLATVSQVHSAELHIIKGPTDQWNPGSRGDALATASQNVAIAVQVADCFPVLVSDPRSGVIATVHAGWRGAVARILQRTLESMRRDLGADLAEAVVAIGPGIRSCCLEVGSEVEAAFAAEYPRSRLCAPHPVHPGKHMLDLPAALRIQLAEAGHSSEKVYDLGLCTRCHPDQFFSYRAEGSHAGRMMAVICRTGKLP